MNEKLFNLALQAGGSHYPHVNSMQLEKFAKLLIDECCKVMNDTNCGYFVRTSYDQNLAKAVKEHCIKNINDHFNL